MESDHKSLLGILKQPLTEIFPKLQRMRLRCLRYQFHLEQRPGKDMIVADALSRLPLGTVCTDHDALTEEKFAATIKQTIPTPLGRERCREATSKDPTMKTIIHHIQNGWPSTRKLASGPVKPFWTVRHDLTMKDGMVFKTQQAVAPVILHKTILQSIHDGHSGIVKCIEKAKQSVYFPGYVNEIKDMVASCSVCPEHQKSNPLPDLHPTEVPKYPFQSV